MDESIIPNSERAFTEPEFCYKNAAIAFTKGLLTLVLRLNLKDGYKCIFWTSLEFNRLLELKAIDHNIEMLMTFPQIQ